MSRSLTELKPNDHNALGHAAFADRYTSEWELGAGRERGVLISYLQSSISNLQSPIFQGIGGSRINVSMSSIVRGAPAESTVDPVSVISTSSSIRTPRCSPGM